MHVRHECCKKFILSIMGVPVPSNIVNHQFFLLDSGVPTTVLVLRSSSIYYIYRFF